MGGCGGKGYQTKIRSASVVNAELYNKPLKEARRGESESASSFATVVDTNIQSCVSVQTQLRATAARAGKTTLRMNFPHLDASRDEQTTSTTVASVEAEEIVPICVV